MVLLLVIFLI